MPYNNEFVAMSSQFSNKLGGSDYHWLTYVCVHKTVSDQGWNITYLGAELDMVLHTLHAFHGQHASLGGKMWLFFFIARFQLSVPVFSKRTDPAGAQTSATLYFGCVCVACVYLCVCVRARVRACASAQVHGCVCFYRQIYIYHMGKVTGDQDNLWFSPHSSLLPRNQQNLDTVSGDLSYDTM